MKCKHIKLIMELIFIFILPLLFILPNVSINNNYVYDNDGNFETSSKELEYESIVYNQYYNNYLDFNQLNNFRDISDFNRVNSYEVILNGYYYFNDLSFFNDLSIGHKYVVFFDYSDNVISSDAWIYLYGISSSNISISDNLNKYYFGTITQSNGGIRVVNYNDDYNFEDYNLKLNLIDLTQMFGSGYEPISYEELSNYIDLDNYYNYSLSDNIVLNSNNIVSSNYNLVKSPFTNIKDLISGIFNIDNDNVSFNIVVDYTCIWFIMFVIWHFLYLLFDFIVHLVDKERWRE